MSIEYYIAGFNFIPGSNHLGNAPMETTSYWQTSGDQSSFYFAGSQFYSGSMSLVWKLNPLVDVAPTVEWSDGRFTSSESLGLALVDGITTTNYVGAFPKTSVNCLYMVNSASFIQAQFPDFEVINFVEVEFWQWGGWPNTFVKQFYVYGSNVGSFSGEHSFIGASPVYTTWANSTWKTFSLNNQDGYIHYRFALNPNATEYIHISGIRLSRYTVDGIQEGYFTGSQYLINKESLAALYPGSLYEISAFVNGLANGGDVNLKVFNSAVSSALATSPNMAVTANQWSKVSHTFTVAAATNSPIFRINYVGAGYARTIYIDDAYFGTSRDYEALGVLQIYPEWEMKRFTKQNRHDHRTKGGKLYSYTWGDYERFEIPVDYVPNSKASIVNSWWSTDALIYFKIYSGGVWEVNSCHLMNDSAPLPSFVRPYTNYRKGNLILETF